MPDAARIAQAQALEVPLILQGAKTVEGTDRRELFKANATTTLVFDNGAVLNLRCKLVVGQAVLIHNEQNGREILSKVVEAPPENETGFTELEFTSADPDFWNSAALRTPASPQNPQSAAENPETNGQPTASAQDTVAMKGATASKIHLPNMVALGKEPGGPLREELMPAHEMVPDSSSASAVPVPSFEPAVTTESKPTEPTGDQIDAALRQMSGAAGAAPPLNHGEAPSAGLDSEKDQQHLAAMMGRDARLAKFVAFKEKQAEKLQREAAAKDVAKAALKEAPEATAEFEGTGEPTAVWSKAALLDKLTTGKNATYATIGAAALIVVALIFVWHAMRDAFIHPSDAPVALATSQPKSTAAPAPAADASAPMVPTASAPMIPPTAAAPAKTPQPTVVPAPKAARATRAPAEARMASNRDEATAGTSAAASRGRIQEATGAAEIIPARVVSQPQPTLPPWAKDMELDGVVTMDVTINETGSVAETKVLSGPRPLQHEAERALSLWQFVPARSGGKPISSHITLSVAFLPPLPPKRFP